MRTVNETTSLYQVGGTAIASGGTVTATSISFSPTYEPDAKLVVSQGAAPSGTLIYRFAGGSASGDSATVLAVGTILPTGAGTQTVSLAAFVSVPFVNALLISTGGTCLASANIEAKPRTVQ